MPRGIGAAFVLVVAIGIGVMFLIAAWGKATSVPVQGSPLTILDRFPQWSVYVLVSAEVVVGFWLIVGRRRGSALLVAACMLGGFAGVVAAEMQREQPRVCGCLSASSAGSPDQIKKELTRRLWMNLGMVGLALVGSSLVTTKGARALPRATAVADNVAPGGVSA